MRARNTLRFCLRDLDTPKLERLELKEQGISSCDVSVCGLCPPFARALAHRIGRSVLPTTIHLLSPYELHVSCSCSSPGHSA